MCFLNSLPVRDCEGVVDMAKQAWAQNAVIIQDDGFSVRYRPRCPECGYVPTNRNCGGTAQEGVRAHQSDRCDKFGLRFDIVLSRG